MSQPRGLPGILVVTDAYPPDCGGSGWSTHALVSGLRGDGLQVDVLEVDARDAGPDSDREFDDVRLHAVRLGRYRTPWRHLAVRDYSCEPVRQHVAAILEQRPDIRIVHGQHLHSGQGAALAARAAGRAALVTLRDYWPVRLDGIAWPGEEAGGGSAREWARQALMRSFGLNGALAALAAGRATRRVDARQKALARCQRLICVSDAVRRHVGPEIGAPIDVIPNMIDAQHSAAAAARAECPEGIRAPYLLAAGKLNAMKGFDRVVVELAEAGCTWPLVVAGTGPLEEEMKSSAARAGLQLICCGWTDGDTLLRLAREARAVIVPSVWEEPLGRVILEAMSLATPVIARATGGSPEAIEHGETGFLYGTVEELASALQALEDDQERQRLGAAGLAACAQKYSPEVVVAAVRASYARALDEVDDA